MCAIQLVLRRCSVNVNKSGQLDPAFWIAPSDPQVNRMVEWYSLSSGVTSYQCLYSSGTVRSAQDHTFLPLATAAHYLFYSTIKHFILSNSFLLISEEGTGKNQTTAGERTGM